MKCLFCGCSWHPETGRTFGWPKVFHSCPECFEKEIAPPLNAALKRKERLCARRFRTEGDTKVLFSNYAESVVPADEAS